MKRKALLPLLLGALLLLSGCNYSKPENQNGFFYNTFVHPMDQLLHWLGTHFNDNYGLAIIVIV